MNHRNDGDSFRAIFVHGPWTNEINNMLRAGRGLWARTRHALSRPLNAASGPLPAAAPPSVLATFTTSAPRDAKPMPARPKPPPEDEIEEFYLKGSGPGGQKIVRLPSIITFPPGALNALSRPLKPSFSLPFAPTMQLTAKHTEQDQLGRPAAPRADGHRGQVAGDAIARAEPQDRARAACRPRR